MFHNSILRLLLASFFLYFAWPLIPQAVTNIEFTFWGIWLVFFLLVIGANLATVLQLNKPSVVEQERQRQF